MDINNMQYWQNRYLENSTGWDLGDISPPIKAYIDQLNNKNIKILIPGAGNAHEAEYLHNQGFKSSGFLLVGRKVRFSHRTNIFLCFGT